MSRSVVGALRVVGFAGPTPVLLSMGGKRGMVGEASSSVEDACRMTRRRDRDGDGNGGGGGEMGVKRRKLRHSSEGWAHGGAIRVVTWNMDMGTRAGFERCKAIVKTVLSQRPPVDVVMAQELRHDPAIIQDGGKTMWDALCDGFSKKYDLVVRDSNRRESSVELHLRAPYFVAMWVRKRWAGCTKKHVRIEPFPGTMMARELLTLRCTLDGVGGISFLTAHFESQAIGTEQRREQFASTARTMQGLADEGDVVVFGGDTNLRETEVLGEIVAKTVEEEAALSNANHEQQQEHQEQPICKNRKKTSNATKLSDAWVQAGCNPDTKFTWDMNLNDNLTGFTSFKPRTRYDRVFLTGPPGRRPRCTSFQLLGKERLRNGLFPSDHWGVMVTIETPPRCAEDVSAGLEGDSSSTAGQPGAETDGPIVVGDSSSTAGQPGAETDGPIVVKESSEEEEESAQRSQTKS